MDIEDLVSLGERSSVCPYYMSRHLSATAELLFMPYNYLIDPHTRGGLSINWNNAILIFDEAHNIEKVCSDVMSFDLDCLTLGKAIGEAEQAADIAEKMAESIKSSSMGIDVFRSNGVGAGGDSTGASTLFIVFSINTTNK